MELATPPKFLSVFIPLLQSHSPLCSFATGINPSENFGPVINKHY